jgi:predicted nucleotidyltransferase
LSRLAAGLGPLYAERLAGVFLYGARARGDAQPDADVEIVVVLNTIDRYGDELERTSAAFAGISLELGLIVSRVFVSEAAWQSEIEGRLSVMRSEAMSG